MADAPEHGAKKVFISYKREERDLALFVREKLGALGVEFFIDVELTPDGDFGAKLDKNLAEAGAVLVLWTTLSKSSDFVCSEAQKGFNRQILVAARFDQVSVDELSVPFNRFHTSDLSDWKGSGASLRHPEWQSVLAALGRKLERPGLARLALVLDGGAPEAKHAFLREFPRDAAAPRIAAELEAVERTAFEKQMLLASRRLGRRQSDTQRKLKDCGEDFEAQLAQMRLGKGFVRTDPMRVFDAKAEALRDKVAEYQASSQQYQLRVEQMEQSVAASIERAAQLEHELRVKSATFDTETAALVAKHELAASENERKGRALAELNEKYQSWQSTVALLPELKTRLIDLERETEAKERQIADLAADNDRLRAAPPPIARWQVGAGLVAAAAIGLLFGALAIRNAPVVAGTDDVTAQLHIELEKTKTLSEQLHDKTREIAGVSGRLEQAQTETARLREQVAVLGTAQANAKQSDDRTKTLTTQLQTKEVELGRSVAQAAELRAQLATALQELGSLRGQQQPAAQKKQPARSVFLTASRPTPQFTTYANHDMDGGDYLTKKDATRDWCETECKSAAQCVAYTFDKWNSHCSLKDKISEVKLEPKGDTAVRADQGKPRKSDEQERFCPYDGEAFQGTVSQTYTRVSRPSCRETCRGDQTCIAFTFIASADNTCRLFSSTSGRAGESGATSEIKAQKPRSSWCRF